MVLISAPSFVPTPSVPPPAAHFQQCRILCYGDSLTAGYYANGKRFSPYGKLMQESLRSHGFQCDVSICGISGHRADQMVAELDSPVCRDIVGKLGKGLAHILDTEGPYDLVILMAGTNDFVPNVKLQAVRDSVCRLHAACHKRGVPTVMLAAPTNAVDMRVGLARLLKDWASRNPTKVLGFLDPEDVMPRSKAACWESDQVHFSPTGSRTLGAHLAGVVAPILKKLGQTARGQAARAQAARSQSATRSRGLQYQVPAPAMLAQAWAAPMGKQMFHRPGSPVIPVVVATPRLFPARGGA